MTLLYKTTLECLIYLVENSGDTWIYTQYLYMTGLIMPISHDHDCSHTCYAVTYVHPS